MLWRGAIDWPAFLTGRSMIVAGELAAKLVIYPIAAGSSPDHRLTNWAVTAKLGADDATAPPQKERLVATGPHGGAVAAYPAVSNRQRQCASVSSRRRRNFGNIRCAIAIRCRAGRTAASRFSATPRIPCIRSARTAPRRQSSMPARSPTGSRVSSEHPIAALWAYEQERLPMTAQIVRMNRKGGPEGVIDVVEELAPNGFDDIEQVLVLRAAPRHRPRLCGDRRLRQGAGQQGSVNSLTPRAAAGTPPRAWPRARPRLAGSAPSCCGSPRTGRRACASGTLQNRHFTGWSALLKRS